MFQHFFLLICIIYSWSNGFPRFLGIDLRFLKNSLVQTNQIELETALLPLQIKFCNRKL